MLIGIKYRLPHIYIIFNFKFAQKMSELKKPRKKTKKQ